MTAMENQVLAFCRANRLIAPGDQVVCALSGGKDSVALLWCLYLLREKLGFTLSAAHVNHGLRPGEADRDEAFVRQLCQGYGIPLAVGRVQVQARGRGVEDAARRARYTFLETLPGKIATAHTADDNAETVLMHLLRGTGLAGLGGIAPARGRIIRPMLLITAQEVEGFLHQWNLPHVEDSTNAQGRFLRNRLRQQVLPVLCRENPRFPQGCSRMAMTLRQDGALLDRLARQAGERLTDSAGALDCAGVMALDPALRRRVLGSFLRQAGTAEPEAVHIAQAEALAESNSPSAWGEFPSGVVLMRQYGKLVNYHPGPPLAETALPVPGEVRAGGWLARCKISPPGEKRENSPFTFALACDTIRQTPLVLRPRRPGDRLCLPGGTKTVKKLFIDRKIPAAWRDTLPVLAAGDRVLAVAGIGGDVRFLPQPGAPAVTVSLEKIK